MERALGGKAEEWRERIAEQGLSGRTVAVFCRERGLKEWAFYEWKRRLRGSVGGKKRSRFIAVKKSGPVLEKRLRVELPNGVRIELGGGLESEEVRGFLRELCGVSEEVRHAKS